MKKSAAFSLFEIMIVVVVIGMIATTMFPRLMRQDTQTKWPHILAELNNLVFFTRQQAILEHTVFRISIEKMKQGTDQLFVEIETVDPEKPDKKIYKAYHSSAVTTRYVLPREVLVQAVFQGGKEQLEEHKGRFAYCYIVPDGIVQDIMIRMTRTVDGVEEKGSFKVRPFLGNFEFFEGWIKPEKS